MQDLIVVKQLPQIEEHLKELSIEIEQKVENAKSLVCTEENVKVIKQVRADLNKEFKDVEQQRKIVKEQILAPCMHFEEVYKQYVTEKYRSADTDLKTKIDNVENNLKEIKRQEAISYFDEYAKSLKIDFVKFEDMNLNINLTSSKSSIKKATEDFLNRINIDLATIALQQNKEEMIVEYKQNGYKLNEAITTVINRQERIKAEQLKQQEQIVSDRIEEEKKAVQEAIKPFQSVSNTVKEEKIYTITFTVTGTAPRLKQLKDYLIREGYQYE